MLQARKYFSTGSLDFYVAMHHSRMLVLQQFAFARLDLGPRCLTIWNDYRDHPVTPSCLFPDEVVNWIKTEPDYFCIYLDRLSFQMRSDTHFLDARLKIESMELGHPWRGDNHLPDGASRVLENSALSSFFFYMVISKIWYSISLVFFLLENVCLFDFRGMYLNMVHQLHMHNYADYNITIKARGICEQDRASLTKMNI